MFPKLYDTKHIIPKNAVEYIRSKDDKIALLVDFIGDIESYYAKDHFTALVSQIVFQLINYNVAVLLWNRLVEKVDPMTPENLLSFDDEDIRSVGLTRSKVQYMKNIAKAFLNEEINLNFDNMSDDEVYKEVQKIKGVGPWTAEMFLIFGLYRLDIFSYGDIAIRNAIVLLYELDHDLSKKEFEVYQKKFSPYGTIASFYLWEITLRNIKKEDLFT